jgi:hypothetical protein
MIFDMVKAAILILIANSVSAHGLSPRTGRNFPLVGMHMLWGNVSGDVSSMMAIE